MANREEALRARQDLLEQLQQLPDAMRERPQWLVWKYFQKPKAPKPAKLPFYVSGRPRGWPQGKPADGLATEAQPQVEQGHELDRAALVSFDDALRALDRDMALAGIGFAFLPGDGLIGVDIDGAIDGETGEISGRCRLVMQMCPSYTELSVSGKGVHIILSGEIAEKFKSDEIGLEVYAGSQFFTCTGRRWGNTPNQVQAADADAMAIMQGMCAQAKAEAKAKRDADRALERAAADGQAPRPAKPRAPASSGEGGNDFKRVNDAAMANLDAWVPELFPKAHRHATTHGDGYRISSKDLGRQLQEDLAITPGGIKDFGEEVGKSPIDLVMQWMHLGPHAALLWLAARVGVEIKKRSRSSTSVARPEPPPEGEARGSDGDDDSPVPHGDEDGGGASEGGEGGEARMLPSKKKGKGGGDKPPKDIDWEKFEHLRHHFALIYGTDTVWDGEKRIIMKIANMGHAHGSDMVRLWKGGKSSPNRADTPGARWTVMPERVVFDPTEACDPDLHVNLFGGFPTEPKAGDVGPILELVKFLCSRTSEDEDERDRIVDWLLCWWAYPLQNKGAKLRTSVVMHGDEGAGKNFLTDTMVAMYGEYGTTVGQDELEDKFNDWRSRKLLVVGDEVSSRAELVHNKNRLKALITSTTVQINPKNLPRREEANHINVVFNSNELQPLALDNSDRRYLVIYTPKAREFEFYRNLGEWRKGGGVAAFLHYLLEYDTSGFDPFAPAPATKAKAELIELNRKSPERFWLEWSGGELQLPYRSCTGVQAYQAYETYCRRIGDRFPVQRHVFTSMAKRISDTMGKAVITDKVMNVDYSKSDKRKDETSTRMFLVRPIPPTEELVELGFTTQGAWATDVWRSFETELNKFRRRYSDGDDTEGPPM